MKLHLKYGAQACFSITVQKYFIAAEKNASVAGSDTDLVRWDPQMRATFITNRARIDQPQIMSHHPQLKQYL
jgi:hypothetical protein